MKKSKFITLGVSLAAILVGAALIPSVHAEDGKDDAIKQFMKTYHKAPKGQDPICKKASEGKATPEELKKLVAGYKTMCAAKAPRGDAASWKDKTSKLLAAAEALQKGETDATSKYKAAVNCKACHEAHKPD